MCMQLVGPLEEDESFSEQDYSMLVQLDNSSYAHAIAEAVGGVEVGGVSPDEDTSAFRSRLVLKVSSLLRSQPQQRRIPGPSLNDKHRLLCSSLKMICTLCMLYDLYTRMLLCWGEKSVF